MSTIIDNFRWNRGHFRLTGESLPGCPVHLQWHESLYLSRLLYDLLPYRLFFPAIGTFVYSHASGIQAYIFQVCILRKSMKHHFQCTVISPFGKSSIERLPRTMSLGQLPPLSTTADDLKHSIEHHPVIFPGTASFSLFLLAVEVV